MENVLKSYEMYLKEDLSANTVASYMGDLNRFFEECGINSIKSLKKCGKAQIDEYITSLKNKGRSYSSVLRAVASLKKFFAYCEDNHVLKHNPAVALDAPRNKRKLPNTISEEETIKILEAPNVKTLKGVRDKAMLELLYATGARVSEIVDLKVSDVSLKNELVVLPMGDKHRFVPLGSEAVAALSVYIKGCRNRFVSDKPTDVLFVNLSGEPLTRQGFWKIVKTYVKQAGIGGSVTAQTIRHSFALHLLKNGADANSVAEMLGYSDVASTKIYYDVMNSQIKEVYRKSHPRA